MLAACLVLLAALLAGTPTAPVRYEGATASFVPTPQSPSRATIPDDAKLRRLVRAPVTLKVALIPPAAVAPQDTAEASPPLRRIGPSDPTRPPPSAPLRQVRHSRAPPSIAG